MHESKMQGKKVVLAIYDDVWQLVQPVPLSRVVHWTWFNFDDIQLIVKRKKLLRKLEIWYHCDSKQNTVW